MCCKCYGETGLHSWNILARRYIIQAGLTLCDCFLCDFALTQLENLQHSLSVHIFFGLTQFGMDDPWPHLSSVEG